MHITLETAITICTTIAALAMAWGIMKAQVRNMKANLDDTVAELESYRSKTEREFERIRLAQEQQLDRFVESCRTYRSECRANWTEDNNRIEKKIDNLDKKIDEQTIMFLEKVDSLVKYFHDKLQTSDEATRSIREDVAALKAVSKERLRV